MENLALPSTGVPVLGPAGFANRWRPPFPAPSVPSRWRVVSGGARRAEFSVCALGHGSNGGASPRPLETVLEKLTKQAFASISSSSSNETSAASGNPQLLVPPQSSNIGSPLFWIGVGVGLSALFSMVVARVKRYMMQQAFKTMMGQMSPENGQFNNPSFFPGSVPYPAASLQTPVTSQPVVTVDVPATEVERTPIEASKSNEPREEPKKYGIPPP